MESFTQPLSQRPSRSGTTFPIMLRASSSLLPSFLQPRPFCRKKKKEKRRKEDEKQPRADTEEPNRNRVQNRRMSPEEPWPRRGC